jgi:hypothetical protein
VCINQNKIKNLKILKLTRVDINSFGGMKSTWIKKRLNSERPVNKVTRYEVVQAVGD